jgi:hypothetical protein
VGAYPDDASFGVGGTHLHESDLFEGVVFRRSGIMRNKSLTGDAIIF